jgi:hypothetical protein
MNLMAPTELLQVQMGMGEMELMAQTELFFATLGFGLACSESPPSIFAVCFTFRPGRP